MLPTTQEYKISLMIGQDSFRTLEGVEVIPNPNYPDEPWYSTGGLAIVFKLKRNDKLYALKCFYTEAHERQERLGLIAAYLKQNPSPYFVDFTYLENELWVQTDNNEGQGYPVVLMEWVEGKTLDNYLEQICTQNNTPALKNLYFQFCNLAWWLQQQPIAHGDIKHDNLIVTPDRKLKLIDYDGVFVPALRGRKANEMGSPCYQHPKRDAYFFDKNLDDFSLLVLQITLLALQQQPKLFTEHYNGDGIILKDTDHQNFAQSPIKTILWQLPEVKIPLLLSQLQGNLNNLSAIDLMPVLQDVAWINWLVDGQKDGKLEFDRQRLKELVLGDWRWKNLFAGQVSRNYSLNEKLIEKHKDKWDWEDLSGSKSLLWSLELIEKYEDKWKWWRLCKNNALPWSVELINKYIDTNKWTSETLSRSEAFPWSMELIEKYKEKWDFWYLSVNIELPWSLELIEKYKHEWNWDWLSKNKALPWSLELIEKYEDKWDWNRLSENEAIPWSIELIEKYQDKWNWDGATDDDDDPYNPITMGMSGNSSLPWSIELLAKYADRWKWYYLSLNKSLLYSYDLIEKFEDRWEWKNLSKNKFLPWSLELIGKFKDKWDWKNLTENISFPFIIEFGYKKCEWAWDGFRGNGWSLDLIENYKDKWEWFFLSRNENLPWSIDLIEKIKDEFGAVQELTKNNSVYEKVFQPLLNDEFIDEVMSEIKGDD